MEWKFGDETPKTLNSFVIVRKAEDVKRFGCESRYAEQTIMLREALGERGARFNGVWRQVW